MNIELYMLDKLKARVQLARQIDVAQHKANKAKHDRNWIKETADAMEIELDSDFAARYAQSCLVCLLMFELRQPRSDAETKRNGPTKRQQKATSARAKDQRLQLKQLLTQPLLAPGISKRYITSGSNPIVHELLAGESESTPFAAVDTKPVFNEDVRRRGQAMKPCLVSRKLLLDPTCWRKGSRSAVKKRSITRSGADSPRPRRSQNRDITLNSSSTQPTYMIG
jgi:hypothetical protein